MSEPTVFKPHALAKSPVIREGRILRDLTMPELDLAKYDAPASDRLDARSVCAGKFNRGELQ